MDWREKGFVSVVADQGMCGSDWAFSANGAVEGAFAVQTGEFTDLSVQQLLDCTGSSTGCHGGTMAAAFDYLETHYAMSAEAYPYYTAYAARSDCKYDESKATTAMVDTYTYAKSGDIEMMKRALSHQPIAAALNASTQSFQMYVSGVYDDEACGPEVDHSVILVGYGELEGEEYWIVKNSWSESWGENGYIRVA